MKNWIGLLIALSLGVVACLLNWQYLDRKSKEIEVVSFLSIADDVRLKQGDTFLESHFVQLDIPRKNVGSLQESAVLFSDLQTVVSLKALHDYRGGEVVLRQELKTPPSELKLEKGELAFWIPVNSATFVSALVQPGDTVSFMVPNAATVFEGMDEAEEAARPTGPEFGFSEPPPEPAPVSSANSELVGPFRVISLGDRLGSFEVSSASGRSRARENVIGVAVKKSDPKSEKLFRLTGSPGFRQAGVVLHPRESDKQ